jgi:homoserine kinase type II
MAFYTKLSRQEIQAIAGQFDIKVISYTPIDQGLGNSNYLLATNQGQYVLTVFEIEPSQVTKMVEVLRLLEKNDFPAPRLERLNTGKVVTEFKGKSVSLKPYILGQVLDELHIKQVYQVGTALAKLHEFPAPDNLSSQHTYVKTTYPQVMNQEINLNYKKRVSERYKAILASIPPNLPVGIVHGDIFPDNLLFEDGEFKAIIDFEDVSRIYKIFDLGMAIVGLCTNETEIDISKSRALVSGYQEIRSLEEPEKKSLKTLIELAAILTSTWRFWKYNIDMPDMGDSNKYVHMVDIAKNAKAIPSREFNGAMFG